MNTNPHPPETRRVMVVIEAFCFTVFPVLIQQAGREAEAGPDKDSPIATVFACSRFRLIENLIQNRHFIRFVKLI